MELIGILGGLIGLFGGICATVLPILLFVGLGISSTIGWVAAWRVK